LTRHLEAEAGCVGWPREAAAWPGLADARWEMKLTCGARLAVTEGAGVIAGLRKREEETYFGQYATTAQAGMGRACALPAGEKGKGRWLAGLRSRVGWLAVGPIGPKAKEKFFSE
jgi:hypothetical protein